MMKQEFEERLGREVSDSEYTEIEYVYTWHPAISATDGKNQIAEIFKAGGLVVIRSMREAAEMAQDLDAELRHEMEKVRRIKQRIQKVKDGDTSLEKCVKEMDTAYDLAENPPMFAKMCDKMREKYGSENVSDAKAILGI